MNLFGRSEQENTNYKRITKTTIYIKNLKVFSKKIVLQFFDGSDDGNNVEMFKEIKEIDGFLIGGASKSSKKFIDMSYTIDKPHGKFTHICKYCISSDISCSNFITKIRRWCFRFGCFTRQFHDN